MLSVRVVSNVTQLRTCQHIEEYWVNYRGPFSEKEKRPYQYLTSICGCYPVYKSYLDDRLFIKIIDVGLVGYASRWRMALSS